jgi:hypothetical protein
MPTVELRLFATLAALTPANSLAYPIESGMRVRELLVKIGVPVGEAKLIFVNGVRAELESRLFGNERVGIFPPVGGG